MLPTLPIVPAMRHLAIKLLLPGAPWVFTEHHAEPLPFGGRAQRCADGPMGVRGSSRGPARMRAALALTLASYAA
jgi:hypothetical protein